MEDSVLSLHSSDVVVDSLFVQYAPEVVNRRVLSSVCPGLYFQILLTGSTPASSSPRRKPVREHWIGGRFGRKSDGDCFSSFL